MSTWNDKQLETNAPEFKCYRDLRMYLTLIEGEIEAQDWKCAEAYVDSLDENLAKLREQLRARQG